MGPSKTGRVLLHIANGLWIFFVLFPLAAVTFAAIQSEEGLMRDLTSFLPHEVTTDNFRLILLGEESVKGYVLDDYLPDTIKSFYVGFLNSTVISLSVTFLCLLCGAFSAYTIVRLRFRWTLWILRANVFARFVPILVLMIPLYVVMRGLGLLNSLEGVILAKTGFFLPFAILILTPYFESIPAEMEDAARLDGCTRFAAFWRILLPLAAPGIAACGVIMFIISWHELIITLILNSRTQYMTLPVILATMVGETQTFFNLIMAIALLALLPTLILVLLLRKYVVDGLSAGALKG